MRKKQRSRLLLVSSNALRQVLISVLGMAVPFMAVHRGSKTLWGGFVALLLYVMLALQLINWGHKEYLLRSFSLAPNKIAADYTATLLARFPLVVVAIAVGFWFFPGLSGCWLGLWIFGRYLYHATEALVVYEKRFNASMLAELLCFLVFCLGFYAAKSLDVLLLLAFFSSYQFLKGLVHFLLFRSFFRLGAVPPDWHFYKSAFPFFLLSVLGFFASKADVYLIQRFTSPATTAAYQVLNSLLVFIMSVAPFLFGPFTRNIYRDRSQMTAKAKKALAAYGLFLVPAGLAVSGLLLFYFMQLQFSIWFYLVAFAYVYPSFCYGLDIVELFGCHREKTVTLYLFAGAFANTLFSALLLYAGYGITGALAGSAAAQIIVLFLLKSRRKP